MTSSMTSHRLLTRFNWTNSGKASPIPPCRMRCDTQATNPGSGLCIAPGVSCIHRHYGDLTTDHMAMKHRPHSDRTTDPMAMKHRPHGDHTTDPMAMKHRHYGDRTTDPMAMKHRHYGDQAWHNKKERLRFFTKCSRPLYYCAITHTCVSCHASICLGHACVIP